MPHCGFVMFSVLLPQWKPRNDGYLTSLHLASAPRINQSSLKLIINYSGGVKEGSKMNQNQPSHSFFPFLCLMLSLGITVVALCSDFFFSLGSILHLWSRTASPGCFVLSGSCYNTLPLIFWRWAAKFKQCLILFKALWCPVCGLRGFSSVAQGIMDFMLIGPV